MGVFAGPEIKEDGLVLALDAGNSKGYDKYENLLKYSNDFSQSDWIKQSSHPTPSKDAIGPDGVANSASTFYRTATDQYVYQSILGAGTYTLSAWVKSEAATGSFTMQGYNGTDGVMAESKTATNEWQRFETTISPAHSSTNYYPCIPTNTNTNFYVWGAQVERGSYVNDYYETTSTAKTRGTTWTDLSGKGNNGTLTNGPTYSSDNGGYLDFDGENDYISGVINDFDPDTSCTLETFVRRPTTPPAWRTYFNIKPNSDSNSPFFEFRTSGANLVTVALYYDGTTNHSTTSYTLNFTDFYHLVAVYDGAGNIHLYVNGSLHNTKTSVPAFGIGANPRITIGRAYSEDRPTNIEMSVCRVYNKALTASEIQQNFNALRGRFGI